jgi:hypothetical protein
MSILNYLQGLLPVFGRDRIIEDLRMARTEFLETAPALKEIIKTLNSATFRSEEAKRFQRSLGNYQAGQRAGENILAFVARTIPNLVSNIETIERLAKSEYQDTVATQGMDLRQLNLVQIADALNFASRYTRFMTNFIVRKEFEATATAKKVEFEVEDILFEAEYIEQGLVPYLTVLRYLGQDPKKIMEALANIPEMIAKDVNYKELANTVGERKIEPFPLSTNNFSWSPFYMIRMSNVEARDARFKECKAQVASMQVQLLRLQQAAAGKSNPGLERDAAYLQKMIAMHAKEMEQLSGKK